MSPQIVDSIALGDAATLVSLFSASQSAGRLTGGWVSDWVVARLSQPRVLCIAATAVLMACAHVVLLVARTVVVLYAGVALAGFAFGCCFPLMVVCVSELFGVEHFGQNYMFFDGLGQCLGSLLLGSILPSRLYAALVPPGSSTQRCVGRQCFATTHEIVAGSSAVASVLALVLAWRSRQRTPKMNVSE